ncbi:MAG: radical SAM family heme chaperone HemW [Bacteriovoracaceae bacterium]|nr:radical SAM family heme chaperone HemW [Bacteriovoracaceae bacterium]
MNDVLGLYIHFPFCIKKCNYCDFHSQALTENKLDVLHTDLGEHLIRVNKLHREQHAQWGALETIYIGGGTPTLWGQKGRNYLQHFLKQFQFSNNLEFTIEVNPKSTNIDEIKKWMDIGVNRFSIGVQSLDDRLLGYLDRVHSADEACKLLKEMGQLGISYSADLMMGLPFSDGKRNLRGEASKLIDLGANHLSSYVLTVDESYKHYCELPCEEQIEDEFLSLSDYMIEQGFAHYEVSNFAKPGNESRHNLKYWNSDSIGAIGPSATGVLASEKEHIRYKWNNTGIDYELENVTEDELVLEKFYMAFRSSIGVPKEQIPSKILDDWLTKGLVRSSNSVIAATPRGFLLLDSLLDQLFRQKIL